MAGEGSNLMPLFGGKTSKDDPAAGHLVAPPVVPGQTGRARVAPTCDRARRHARRRTRSGPPRPTTLLAPGRRSTVQFVPGGGAALRRLARDESIEHGLFALVSFSWTSGYLINDSLWGRIYGTLH
jgi:hypothetical protein